MRWQTKSEANDYTKQLELIVWRNDNGEWCWTVNHLRYSLYGALSTVQVKFFDEPCASEEEARIAAETWCDQYTPPKWQDEWNKLYLAAFQDYLRQRPA